MFLLAEFKLNKDSVKQLAEDNHKTSNVVNKMKEDLESLDNIVGFKKNLD